MNIVESTRRFEEWLRGHTRVVEKDLDKKHDEMEKSAFVFLRATFYRWAQRFPEVCPKTADAPTVLSIGDLHLENFGTWRDFEGRLVWGVNDFDEAHPLPYTNDLVRLGASAFLAKRENHIGIERKDICRFILQGYRESLGKRGRPIVLAEHNEWLGAVAVKQLKDPEEFWEDLEDNKPTDSPRPRAALRRSLPPSAKDLQFLKRRAGVGSLGRERGVAIAVDSGARVAREAKAFLPSAAVWAAGDRPTRCYGDTILHRAVRSPDPFLHVHDPWVIRRLAPDCVKIGLGDLPRSRDEHKMLHAMGWETANVHLGGMKPAVLRDLGARPPSWLERAAGEMADATFDDWRDWRAR